MSQSPSHPPADNETTYGGFSRFEVELEFVQSLANPYYLNHLASQKFLSEPAFIAYLNYLQYWSKPPYTKYLTYPGPTLKHLELLQQERFRQEIISPELVQVLAAEDAKASMDWHKDG
ncbi:mediator complex, subunit Med31 [Xylariales sp. AK1849]|nr:mediator complex, subunit Med31 [Xylariales sp. AK1849]